MKKQTLPQHTLLASQGVRIGAFIIDAAISLAFFMVFFFGCFNLIFNSTINFYEEKLHIFEVNSHLVYEDENKVTKIYSSTEDYKIYETPMTYYFFCYLTGENIEVPEGKDKSDIYSYAAPNYNDEIILDDGTKILPKDYYSISWYNKNILEINDDNLDEEKTSTLFIYEKDEDGNFLKDKLGVPKTKYYNTSTQKVADVTKTELAKFYTNKYIEAYKHFKAQSFYQKYEIPRNFFNGLSATLAINVAGMISYILFPCIFKGGATLGKKFFKLGLANYEGYAVKKYQIPLRFIPFFITSLAVMFLSTSYVIMVLIPIAVLLTSFGLMMASPKKSAIHDYIARTLVIDMKSSLIFADVLEEEKYINNETEEEIIQGGEEPELRYEK